MPGSAPPSYGLHVFINCPFDRQYLDLLNALIFTVHDCGFIARCALEITDASQVRIEKIFGIITECRVGVHDLSRTEVNGNPRLPRFNMPLELGMFLGAKRYGDDVQRQKVCLILDRDPHRYQRFCSDIAGQDIAAHDGKIEEAIKAVRALLAGTQRDKIIPGPAKIHRRYLAFLRELPTARRKFGLTKAEVGFIEFTTLVSGWIIANPRG